MTDYIKREDAIGLAKDIILPSGAIIGYHSTKPIVIWRCIDTDEVMELPSADVRENVKGEWIDITMWHDEYFGNKCQAPAQKCSNCGEWSVGINNKFCSNCGADMRSKS